MMRPPTSGNSQNKASANVSPVVRVEIFNQTYTIRADGNHDYLIALAAYVDRKMREITSTTATIDSVKVAVLAALNIADELHRIKADAEQADAHLASHSTLYAQLLDGVLRPRPNADLPLTDNTHGPAS